MLNRVSLIIAKIGTNMPVNDMKKDESILYLKYWSVMLT